MPRPRTYPDDLRDQLIAAATGHLRVNAPATMSLRELAASVDTSTNAIYSIFGSKDALIDAVIDAARPAIAERQCRAMQNRRGVDALRGSMADYRAWALENPCLYPLVIGDWERPGAYEVGDAAFDAVHDLIAELMTCGHLRGASPTEICLSLWASVHGFVLMELTRQRAGQAAIPDALFEDHLENCLRGVAGPRAEIR